jgi:hypothetical protein
MGANPKKHPKSLALGRQLGRKNAPKEPFRQTLERIWAKGKDA